jgi:hypothetical protein
MTADVREQGVEEEYFDLERGGSDKWMEKIIL